jgi:hypothetical protein
MWERQKMVKQKSKAFYNMLLSQAFGNLNSTTVLLTNKNNRDGKAIMKLLEDKETLKLVIFYGKESNIVYTFQKQQNNNSPLFLPYNNEHTTQQGKEKFNILYYTFEYKTP